MLRVIVHVKHQRSKAGIDVEVPAEIPIAQLAELLAQALQWNDCGPSERVTYTVREAVGGAPLALEASLATLNLWDGTTLLFEPTVHRRPTPSGQTQAAFLASASGRRYSLGSQAYHLGRSSATGNHDRSLVDLRAEPLGSTVSRHHADLKYEQGGWVLHCSPDAQNQTLLNGVLLPPGQSRSLQDEDEVQLGGVKLTFRIAPHEGGMGS